METKNKHMTNKLEIPNSIARKHKGKSRNRRLMTDEQLNLVRQMRSSGFSHAAIFKAMKEQNMMPYKSFQTFYIAYKNR